MIPREKVDEIIARIDIGALIGKYVTLKQHGKDLKGLCPFHSEKTPSFVVHPDRGFFKCFGCGEGGGAIQFLMKIESLSFHDAVRILAEQAGVPISTTPAEKRELSERDRLRKIMKTSVEFYHETLMNTPLGREARAYLKQRGVDSKTAAAFKLGYAPESGDFLVRHLHGRNCRDEEMEKIGLARRGKYEFYDYFKNRIIFPIADSQGRFVGMGGRGMADDANPKYLNTPQSPLFQKKQILYGLHLAKLAVRKFDRIIVVEGYMDAISLYEAGIENVVASMGTALTEEQAKAISRYSTNVVFAYDADAAGEAATVRGIEIFEKAGLHVRIVSVPPGEDPDSIIRKKGAEFFINLINSARSIIDYKIDFLKTSFNLETPEGKEKFVREITPIIREIRGDVRRSEYIRIIAERNRIPEELIRKAVQDRKTRKRINIDPVTKKKNLEPAEKLLAYLFANPGFIPLCLKLELELDERFMNRFGKFAPKNNNAVTFDLKTIFSPDLLHIYRNLQQLNVEDVQVIGAEVLNGIVTGDEMLGRAVDISMVEGLPPCNEEEIRAIFLAFKKELLEKRKQHLTEEILNGSQDPQMLEYLMEIQKELKVFTRLENSGSGNNGSESIHA